MPSEQPSPHVPDPGRDASPEALRPPYRSGVRSLLGLPVSDGGAVAAALSAPSGGRRYEPSPLLTPGEHDGRFEQPSTGGAVTEAESGPAADATERIRRRPLHESEPLRNFPRAPRPDGARLSPATLGQAGDDLELSPPSEYREQTRLVIPGVSIRRTVFPALSGTADSPAIAVEGEPRDAIPEQASPLEGVASIPPEIATSGLELLTRLEQLADAGAIAQNSSQSRAVSTAGRPPGRPEPPDGLNGERSIPALAQRLEQLQRTVIGLAATVSSHEARRRAESPFNITRSEEPDGAPRAFWERSRLGRGLFTGR